MNAEKIDWTEMLRRLAAAESAIAEGGRLTREQTRETAAQAKTLHRSHTGALERRCLQVLSFLRWGKRYTALRCVMSARCVP